MKSSIHRFIFLTLIMLINSGCTSNKFSQSKGIVLNNMTGEPMDGVSIDADCIEYFSSHASRVVKSTTKMSSGSGHFYFNVKELNPCHDIHYRASYPGYTVVGERVLDASVAYKDGSTVYFTLRPNATLRSFYIQRMEPKEEITAYTEKGGELTENLAGQFTHDYVRYQCARNVAKTPEQTAYIREHFCTLLMARLEIYKHSPDMAREKNYGYNCPWIQGASFSEIRYSPAVKIDVDSLTEFCSSTR